MLYSIDLKQILLIDHKKLGMWLYPGGHVEGNEDPAECAIREVREEVGLSAHLHPGPSATVVEKLKGTRLGETIVLPQPFVILSEVIGAGSAEAHRHIDMVFLATGQGVPHLAEEEANDARWLDIDVAVHLTMPPELPMLILGGRDYLVELIPEPGVRR